MSLWSQLRNRSIEERLDQNAWAQMYQEMMNYGGNSYPISWGSSATGSNHERIGNDFVGYVQGAYKSSGIVFACMAARMLVFSEARFSYQRLDNGRPGELFPGQPQDLALLEKPWPRGTTGALLKRALTDVDLAGTHYMVTEGAGPSERLRWLRPDWVDIVLTKPPDVAVDSDIAGHIYKPGGTDNADLWETYPIDGSNGIVAQWSAYPDPEAQYRGMSWLTPVLREIMSDKAMNQHKQKYFENAATPSMIVSLKETVTDEQFQEFMEAANMKTGVESAYEPLYIGGGADVTLTGSTLQQMDFRNTAGHGETRIAAAARVHPVIVGVAEGMHGTALTSDNLKAAKGVFADGTMRPMWRELCAAYAPLVPEYNNARLWFDDRDISFLRQDHTDLSLIRQTEAATLNSYITMGFTPDSSKLALLHGDISLLQHTGMYSVQLQPPLDPDQDDANVPDVEDEGIKPAADPAGPEEGEG